MNTRGLVLCMTAVTFGRGRVTATNDTGTSDLTTSSLASCSTESTEHFSDGYCDDSYGNTEVCNWDGGDCCESTCVDGEEFECGHMGYFCKDPTASDYGNETLACGTGGDTAFVGASWLGDGWCDIDRDGDWVVYNGLENLNLAICNWDGGDCCPDTCDDTGSVYECGSEGWDYCQDPSSSGEINFAARVSLEGVACLTAAVGLFVL